MNEKQIDRICQINRTSPMIEETDSTSPSSSGLVMVILCLKSEGKLLFETISSMEESARRQTDRRY